MLVPRIKPGIWVKAQLRLADLEGRIFTVLRRGDDDGGTIIVKIVDRGGMADVLAQTTATSGTGELAWYRPLGPEPVSDGDADAYIARQGDFDPDIWALEVMDRDGTYEISGTVLDQG
ncbi:MAG: DUF1491 family protein [Rhodospirillales bacterium]|jgi:hypothetical protein|nr:DUF1491 family protein [Rhodospirillales bacterium]MBT4006433.1 DUF1491 family protein [Rhodospirillales bacterium]MBT5076471.1 DUF1491 family protein [Rhodospirillales bacterium]MBT5112635.1 DUF1491 family protein [Rhodospirillales bacterium]MBT5673404.1 DUF1491 family protein [Rhodospirillales bacterium]